MGLYNQMLYKKDGHCTWKYYIGELHGLEQLINSKLIRPALTCEW